MHMSVITQDQQINSGLKCPYKYRDVPIETACANQDFCSQMTTDHEASGTYLIHLKHNHIYYSRVNLRYRAELGVILYSTLLKDSLLKQFEDFWNNELLPTLNSFYRSCIAPEIVCPMHLVELPMVDLRKM